MRCDCGQENDVAARRCTRCGALLGRTGMRLWLDAAAGLALLAALAVVFVVDRWTSEAPAPSPTPTSVSPSPSAGLRIAVTPAAYDDMGALLKSLGDGYDYRTISMDDLLDASTLARQDVVFLTCGLSPSHWLAARRGPGAREGAVRHTLRRPVAQRLSSSLRAYVERGGTLYASDWQYDLLAVAFPEFVDPSLVGSGAVQRVRADVIDPGLRRVVGSTIELNFDKPSWKPAAFRGHDLTVLLEGEYETTDGHKLRGPLLVQIPFKGGNIIFTSFHNEHQHSDVERQLLRHLVFTTVTAKVDAGVRGDLVQGGFSPVDRNLLSVSRQDQAVTQVYRARGETSLQFVLGFDARGAELGLAIVGPDGVRLEQSGTSTFSIDVPRAAAGDWTYTITPKKVPYENFPFTLTVGEK